jgi:hypothetical protein
MQRLIYRGDIDIKVLLAERPELAVPQLMLMISLDPTWVEVSIPAGLCFTECRQVADGKGIMHLLLVVGLPRVLNIY